VIEKPDPKNLSDWKGWGELGYVEDTGKYAAAVEKPQVSQGEVFNEGFFNEVVSVAHKHKIPPSQVSALYADVMKSMSAQQAEADAANARQLQELETSLRSEWGGDFDRNRELARRAMVHFGLGAQDSKVLDTALGSPGLVKMFQQIGAAFGEDRLVVPGGGFALPASIDGLRAELNRLHGDPEWRAKLDNPQHPQHRDVVAQRQRIMEKIAQAELAKSGGRA